MFAVEIWAARRKLFLFSLETTIFAWRDVIIRLYSRVELDQVRFHSQTIATSGAKLATF